MYIRKDGRAAAQLRPVRIARSYLRHAAGSVLIETGNTKVICAATIEEKVPPFLRGGGSGWVTAEYAMLPRSAVERVPREGAVGRPRGRTQEIQRIVGRSLRAVTDLAALGERQILIDCDVIEADGGTRTASITGGFVALYDAVQKLREMGLVNSQVIQRFVAAISVGLLEGHPVVDLNYEEDSRVDVDMNVAMTEEGKLVEVQATAERMAFTREQMDMMVELAREGIAKLIKEQRAVLGLR